MSVFRFRQHSNHSYGHSLEKTEHWKHRIFPSFLPQEKLWAWCFHPMVWHFAKGNDCVVRRRFRFFNQLLGGWFCILLEFRGLSTGVWISHMGNRSMYCWISVSVGARRMDDIPFHLPNVTSYMILIILNLLIFFYCLMIWPILVNVLCSFQMGPSLAQMVKSQSAMRETQVWSLGWEDPLEKEMATYSSTLAWRIPWTEASGGYSPWGVIESDTTEQWTLWIKCVLLCCLQCYIVLFVFWPPSDHSETG